MNASKILDIEGDSRVQTIEVSEASGTAASTVEDSAQLDESYKKCIGVALLEITDGNLVDDYDVAIETASGKTLLQQTNKQILETGKTVGQKDKIFPLQFDLRGGEKIVVKTTFTTALASDALNFHVAFLLWRPANPDQ